MGVLSKFYRDYPIKNEHITPIDFNSMKQIPESHAWVEYDDSECLLDKHNLDLESISIIDIEDSNASELIFHASVTWGMFQISNHGILTKLLEEVELQTRKLFNLPLEQKMKVMRSPEGATGYGSPRISPFLPKLMWYEGFTIMENSFVDHAKEIWPNEYQEFCNVMDEYQTRMKVLAEKLMGLILKSLQIPESDGIWEIQDPTRGQKSMSTALQLNSYPSCPDPARSMGLAPHTDTSLFTILHQSGNISGLRLFKDGLGWIRVDPRPGTLVVNVGDLLHIISNARFPSVVHKAVVSKERHRISLAYFYGLPLDFEVSPFLGYKGCEGPCFRALKVNEYVSIKVNHPDLALSHVRIV